MGSRRDVGGIRGCSRAVPRRRPRRNPDDRTAYWTQSPRTERQRELGSRRSTRTDEESPPTVRTGDRAQARSRRRLALEQRRDPSVRPMRRGGGEVRRRRERHIPLAREPTRKGRELTRRGSRSGHRPRVRIRTDGRERMERRILTGASPRREGSPDRARALSRMPRRTEGGLLLSAIHAPRATAVAVRTFLSVSSLRSVWR